MQTMYKLIFCLTACAVLFGCQSTVVDKNQLSDQNSMKGCDNQYNSLCEKLLINVDGFDYLTDPSQYSADDLHTYITYCSTSAIPVLDTCTKVCAMSNDLSVERRKVHEITSCDSSHIAKESGESWCKRMRNEKNWILSDNSQHPESAGMAMLLSVLEREISLQCGDSGAESK